MKKIKVDLLMEKFLGEEYKNKPHYIDLKVVETYMAKNIKEKEIKLRMLVESIIKEVGLDTGNKTLGGSHMDREQNIYSIDTVKDVVSQLNSQIDAPFVNAKYSAIGGERNVSIIVTVSLDPKEQWPHGILQNSRHCYFHIYQDGVVDQFSKSYKIDLKFRKIRAKDLKGVIQKINEYLKKAQ
jgi:hypothetical protein